MKIKRWIGMILTCALIFIMTGCGAGSMAVDLAMTVILLLLMGYSRIGETVHECADSKTDA